MNIIKDKYLIDSIKEKKVSKISIFLLPQMLFYIWQLISQKIVKS